MFTVFFVFFISYAHYSGAGYLTMFIFSLFPVVERLHDWFVVMLKTVFQLQTHRKSYTNTHQTRGNGIICYNNCFHAVSVCSVWHIHTLTNFQISTNRRKIQSVCTHFVWHAANENTEQINR